jgi:hypothetical protein
VAWTRGDQDSAIAAQVEAMRCPEQPDGPTVVVIDDVQLLSDKSKDALGAILVALYGWHRFRPGSPHGIPSWVARFMAENPRFLVRDRTA